MVPVLTSPNHPDAILGTFGRLKPNFGLSEQNLLADRLVIQAIPLKWYRSSRHWQRPVTECTAISDFTQMDDVAAKA